LALAIILETLRINMKPWRYATLSVANLLLIVSLNVVFVVVLRRGVPGILVANALGMVCIVLLGLMLTRGYYALAFSVARLRAMLRYGLPLVPAGASFWAINLAGSIVLVYARNNSIVGVYQGATKLSQALWLVIAAFTVAWGPFAYSIASQDDAKRTYATVLTYYMTTMCGLGLLLSLFSREVLTIFTTNEFVPGYQIVALLALASVSNGATAIVGIGAGLAEKTPHIGWTIATAAAVTTLCNIFLAPHFGIFGAAAGTLLGNVTATYLLYRISQHYYPIPYDGRRVLAVALTFCLLALIGIYCDHVFTLGVLLALLKLGLALAYPTLIILVVLHPADIAAARTIVRRTILSRVAGH
jgi:O-antigen/teichoic acid export membrane protein